MPEILRLTPQGGGGVQIALQISDSDTIGSFIEKLQSVGVTASYNETTGVFSVNIGTDDIIDTDNTGIKDALHLEGVNEGYISNKLQIEVTERVWEIADENTKLSELGTGIIITGTENVSVQNTSGDIYTIEVDSDTTLGEFLGALEDCGLSVNLDNGVVEITGGKISGGTFDAITALGLKDNPYTSWVKGAALTETLIEYEIVTYDTRLVDDLGVSEGYLEVEDSEGDKQYLKIYSGQTIGDLMADLANMGIYSTLDEETGVLTITGGEFNTLTDADVSALVANGTIRETNSRYLHGTDLLTALYGAPAISVNQTAVSQTYAQSRALTKSITTVISATEDTALSELGVSGNQTVNLHKEDGSTVSFNVSGASTLGDLLTALNNQGVNAVLEDGVIYVEGGWMENSTLDSALGLEHTTASSYVLGSVRTVTKTYDADSDTTLAEMGQGLSTITVKGVDGVDVGTITTNADMTIGDVLTALAGYGISGTIKDGIISLDSDIGNYATGGIISSLGVGTTTSTYTTTSGTTATSSAAVTYNTTTYTTTYPTQTRTVITTSTIVTTDPVIGTQTVVVSDTVVTTEPVIGTQTITITNTWTETVADIGTETVTVSDTVTVPVATVGSQTLLITHTHVCTEPVIGTKTITITFNTVTTQATYRVQTIQLSGTQNAIGTVTITTTTTSTTNITTTQYVTTTTGKTTTVGMSISDDIVIKMNTDASFSFVVVWNKNNTGMDVTTYLYNTLKVDVSANDDLVTVVDKINNYASEHNFDTWSYNASTGVLSCSANSTSTTTGVISYIGESIGAGGYGWSTAASTGNIEWYRAGNGCLTQARFLITGPETTVTRTTTTTTVVTTQTMTSTGVVTIPVAYSLSTVVTAVTGSTSVTHNVITTITVENTGTTVVTHQTVTTTVVEKTTTAPVTYTVSDTFTVNTATYKTVTHTLSKTITVENTSTKTVTHTVSQTFTVENTSTKAVTITVLGTAVIQTTTVSVSSTTSSVYLKGDTTFSQLDITSDQTVTVVSDGTKYIVTVNSSDTVDDMLTSLAGIGIYANISSDGKLTLSGDDEAYIIGMSSDLASKLKLTLGSGKSYSTTAHTITVNTDSNHLTHDVTTLMSDETLLSDLGIQNGNIQITEKGTHYTYYLNTGTINTIGDFRNLLSDYGFTSYIDDKGRLVVVGDGDSYLTSLTGGSNIITQLDLDDWTFGKMTQSSSHLTDTTIESDGRVNGDTLLTELQDSSGNKLGITTGEFTVVSNGVRTVETITADTTVDDFISTLATYGMVANVASDGSISIGGQHNSYLATSASARDNTNAIDVLFAEWNFVNVYTSNNIEIPHDVIAAVNRDTKLSDINEGTYSDGCITVIHDGVQTNISLTADDTVGTLMDELALYGFSSVINDSGQLIIYTDGNCTLQNYTGSDKASNVLDLLGVQNSNWIQTNTYTNDSIQTSEIVTSYKDADYDTQLSDLDISWGNEMLKAQGNLALTVDGLTHVINISENETFGSLRDKFAALGLEATISDGVLMIQSGYKDLKIDNANTTSSIAANFGLQYDDDLGGYAASNDNVEQTISWTEDVVLSAANYADNNTQMSLLNISSGTLSVFRNGQRAVINVDSSETFGQLRSRIATAFADVDIEFENGYLKFYSASGASVEVGSTTDTSNISAICGFINDKTGTVKSARELYRVNGGSKIMTSGLFRRGDVTEGTFTIGDAVFSIDNNTTLSGLINQINASESANAVASWDSVDGKLVIKSRTTGSSFINIEAGTSNFTDIMGYTKTEVDDAGNITAKRLDVNTQNVGANAVFAINGTTYTSTSNTIASDVSRIIGVTINLKGVSEGEEIKLTVERDKETVANAVSDIVDAYNELIENVDKEIAKGGNLSDQSTLKFIRNQIRSLMTSSLAGTSVYKNLDSIGISLNAATAGDIRTDNINILNFDADKFYEAFDADIDSLKLLLVGSDTNPGIFQRVETIIEQALVSSYGYFASADKSYNNKISTLDTKIKKANEAVEKYRERLEAKFAAMDLLIANMQNQYSSFLGG